MRAEEYLKKILEICTYYEVKDCTSGECPLRGDYYCGLPHDKKLINEVVKIAQGFQQPKGDFCGECGLDFRDNDFMFCPQCGKEREKDD